MQIENQKVELPILREKKVDLHIKREDRIHPLISGNKYRKLKYNLQELKKRGYPTLLTFGGAYSNHIAATAYAGKKYGVGTVGIIRGEELHKKWQGNPTLRLAKEHGMQFKFISREAYANKEDMAFKQALQEEFGPFYYLSEGGTNPLAIQGCEEILTPGDSLYHVICCAVGTGGTMAGLINASRPEQQVLGFPSLKGDFLQQDICSFVEKRNWSLQTAYHFGGYAKVSNSLIEFVNDFYERTRIPLDPIYTGKMLFGLLDMVHRDCFLPNTKILAIHTGGLQGILGMNRILGKKKLPLIRHGHNFF